MKPDIRFGISHFYLSQIDYTLMKLVETDSNWKMYDLRKIFKCTGKEILAFAQDLEDEGFIKMYPNPRALEIDIELTYRGKNYLAIKEHLSDS